MAFLNTTRGPIAAVTALALLAGARSALPSSGPAAGRAAIRAEDLVGHLRFLAAPVLEGRDSPSVGLDAAAVYLADVFRGAGLEPAPDAPRDRYRRSFRRRMERPDPDACRLAVRGSDGRRSSFVLGDDFVPLGACPGEASGELVFAGFGIDAASEGWDDLSGLSLRGRVAVVVEGEPAIEGRFDGPAVTHEGSLWRKLARLRRARVAGVIVVRRGGGELGYRYTWARWNGGGTLAPPADCPPAIEVDGSCAQRLLGVDVLALAERGERAGRPEPHALDGRRVSFATALVTGDVTLDNVVGWIPGTDLADQVLVVGAHYDHVGVDARGRIGFGADDNASGVSALVELAQALRLAGPRRSVLVAAFAAEEDGLHGSQALCDRPPVPLESVVAMVNLDMIGRGRADEVAVIGVERNPTLARVLERARELSDTGVSEVVTRGGAELWQRSDHYPFHQRGIPVLFFFEGLPIARNADYHTWRDTVDLVDVDKVENTTRLVFNTLWLLANDEGRPPAPRD